MNTCAVCSGTGIDYEQPYGRAIVCHFCKGTGYRLGLNQFSQSNMNRAACEEQSRINEQQRRG